jgi:hypothetical protein
MWRNKIAYLPQDVEFGPRWFAVFLFHPCLVAGLKLQTNTFFAKAVG